MELSIQNLEELRRLIDEVRTENAYADLAKLRMLQGYGVGTDLAKQEDV